MSDRPPAGVDPVGHEVPDEVLREHLTRRAARPAPRALAPSIMARVDETVPARRWRLAVAAWRPRLAMAGSGLALVLVVALLAINAMPATVGTDRGSPSPPGSPAPTGPIWDPAQSALTPPEFLRILAAKPAVGTTFIVDDQIVGVLVSCATSDDCPEGRLVNAGRPVTAPPGGHLPFDSGSEIPGPVALRIADGPDLVFLGGVVSGGLRMAVLRAPDLAVRNAMGGLFVVPAWLWATPPAPCSSPAGTPVPMPTSELGLPAPRLECVPTDWLTDTESTNPERGGGIGFPVQHGAFSAFAVDASNPTGERNPRQGIYLVRDWAGYGEILARLEPTPIPAPDTDATQPTTGPPSAIYWDPRPRPLTPSELVRILATQPRAGTVLIVDDEIAELSPGCAKEVDCPNGKLVSAGVPVRAPVGGHMPFHAASDIPGPLALQVAEDTDLVFLGRVARNGPQLAFAAADLLRGGARDMLYVVHAWLWKTGPLPCPILPTTAPPTPTPTSELGLPAPFTDFCAGANYLTDSAPDLPITRTPSDGILVQNVAYQDFAPTADEAVTPQQAVYLVREWGSQGEIVARLDPMWIQAPTSLPSAPPSDPTVPTGPTSGTSRVMGADEFVGRVLDGSLAAGSVVVADIPASAVTVLSPTGAGAPEDATKSRWLIATTAGSIRVDGIAQNGIAGLQAFLVEPSRAVLTLGSVTVDDVGPAGLLMVHGWLRNGPPLPCPAPARPKATGIRGEPLAWSQCPGTWILPSAADPWAGPPNNVQASDGSGTTKIGDRSVPAGTLHVQDDAAGTYVEVTEGVWLVRKVRSNPCQPGNFCPLVLSDQPGPGVTWYELVGPIAVPQADAVEQRPSPTPAP